MLIIVLLCIVLPPLLQHNFCLKLEPIASHVEMMKDRTPNTCSFFSLIIFPPFPFQNFHSKRNIRELFVIHDKRVFQLSSFRKEVILHFYLFIYYHRTKRDWINILFCRDIIPFCFSTFRSVFRKIRSIITYLYR